MSLSQLENTIKNSQDWLKIAAAIDEIDKKCLSQLLHREGQYQAITYDGLPRDETDLFATLSDARHKRKIDNLLSRNILRQDQYDLLFPINNETDPTRFDITLRVLLFRTFSGLSPLNGQWKEDRLDPTDNTLASLVVKFLALRNRLFHWGSMTTMTAADSNRFWTDVVNVANRFQYADDISVFKTVSLDPDNVLAYKLLYQGIKYSCDNQRNELDHLKNGHDALKADHDHLKDGHGNKIDDLEKELKILEDVIQEIQATHQVCVAKNDEATVSVNKDAPPTDLVLRDVLNIVCQAIGIEWRDLAISLYTSGTVIDDIEKQTIGDDEKMKKCFESKSNNISWKELKNQLNKINRQDIVKKVCQETYLTTALKQASIDLKENYKKTLSKVEDRDVFEDPSCSRYNYVSRQEAFVNLTLSNTDEYNNIIVNSDHMFNLHNQFKLCKLIEIKDVMKGDENLIAFRGIGGIGKTTLIDNITLLWANKELFNGKNGQPNIKYLFNTKCRNLSETDLENVLKSGFPDIFCDISLADIRELDDQVLVVFDGIDELDLSHASTLYDMLKPNSIFQTKFRIWVTGRPNAIRDMMQQIKRDTNPKLVDVMGFTVANINKFIENYFDKLPEKTQKVANMKQKLTENIEFRSMASIPAYLWILCSISQSKDELDMANTNTTLFILASLIIIREYHKALNLSDTDLTSLSQNEKVVDLIINLAELSYKSLNEGKIIFHESDLGENKTELENSGFLLRYINNNIVTFQFRHLIFSEYLSGLYMYLMGRDGLSAILKAEQNSLLWNSVPTILALLHLEKRSNIYSAPVFTNFLKQAQLQYCKKIEIDTDFFLVNDVSASEQIIDDLLLKLFKFSNNSEQNEIYINESWILLLTSVYEYQRVPQFLIDYVINAKRIMVGIRYHQQLRCISYLFDCVPRDKLVDIMNIVLNDGILTDEELKSMKTLLCRCKEIAILSELNCHLFTSLVMRTESEFVTLETLALFFIPDDISHLFQFVPFLQAFRLLTCLNLSVESARILSDCIIKAKNENKLSLKRFLIQACNNEEIINHIISFVYCLTNVFFAEIKFTDLSLKMLVNKLTSNSTKDLSFTFLICNINNRDIEILAPHLPYMPLLSIAYEPGVSDDGYQTIVNTIFKHVDSNGPSKMKHLHLSHLNDDHINILLPLLISELDSFGIHESDKLTIKSFKSIRRTITNRKTILTLIFDVGIDQDSILELFKDIRQFVHIEFDQRFSLLECA